MDYLELKMKTMLKMLVKAKNNRTGLAGIFTPQGAWVKNQQCGVWRRFMEGYRVVVSNYNRSACTCAG